MPVAPLPENLPFAFRGEAIDARLVVETRRARGWLAAHNPTGRPNADVLRETVGLAPNGRLRHRWILDFPAEMTPSERELYVLPHGSCPVVRNPAPAHALRTALARLDRCLAAPLSRSGEFMWLDATFLPDDSLAVWARDDDFSAGVLNSRLFTLWREAHGADLVAALRCYPFPWPPGTPLGSLTREQEEHRHAVAKAVRAGAGDSLNAAVLQAYGWRDDDDEVLITRLRALHAARLR